MENNDTSMIYTQLFNPLCEKADDVYGGRLPVHVRCLIDEAANIGQIPNLEKLVATIRSRRISACLVLQAQSQLKALYKDNADTIIGNMDSRIFLSGYEPTTLKELNQSLGKETIDTYPEGAAIGHDHYGWAIWGGIYLISIIVGMLAERFIKSDVKALFSKKKDDQ